MAIKYDDILHECFIEDMMNAGFSESQANTIWIEQTDYLLDRVWEVFSEEVRELITLNNDLLTE